MLLHVSVQAHNACADLPGGTDLSASFGPFIAHHGSLAVFLLMTLESACIPIPSEVVLPFAGYLAYHHSMSITVAVLVSTLANVFGGLLAYAVGLYGGRPFILRYGRFILLSERHLDSAERWFARYGEITVLVGRLLPAVRTFISLPAGVAKMPLGRFIIYSALGSLPWNLGLVLAGYQLGKHWNVVEHATKPLTYAGAAVLVLAALWFWFGRKRTSDRDMRAR